MDAKLKYRYENDLIFSEGENNQITRKLLINIIENQELQIELMQIIIKKLYNMEMKENKKPEDNEKKE